MGDPAGIGGELTIRAWHALRRTGPTFIALDDPDRLAGIARDLGLETPIRTVGAAGERVDDALCVLPVVLQGPSRPGRPDPANAPCVIASIERAVSLATAGQVGGVVTNPISKATLYGAGFAFPGHTEFLGHLTGISHAPVMMLVCPYMRVVPVTIHVSLRDAISRLTTDAIVAAATVTADALSAQFGIAQPRLAVAGLNPHAGEGGALGTDEADIIVPAIARLRQAGIDVSGPYPPDTMFTQAARPTYDAAICMYHDQALIPLKTLDMTNGVNVTLGLPIVRTSPDHGTAFDIAGAGRADPASLIAAIRLAAELSAHRRGDA